MPTALLTAFAAFAALAYSWSIRRPDADGFAPTRAFPALYIVWFSLGTMNIIAPDPATNLWDPIPGRIWWPIALGFGAYLLGLAAIPATGSTRPDPERWRAVVDSWDHRQARLIGLGLLGLIAATWAIQARGGALALLSDDPGTARVEAAGTRVIWSVYYSAVLAYVPLSLLYVWTRSDASRMLRRGVIASVVGILGLTMLFGNRGVVLEPALLALLVFHYARRPLTLKMQFTMALGGLAFLGIGGIYRDLRQYGPAHIARVVSWGFPLWSLPLTYMYAYIRDGILTFHLLRGVVPDFQPYAGGYLHIAPLATILPGYQDSPDMVFKRMLGNEFVGFGQPATLLGHLYVDGGLAAIVLGLFLFGCLCRTTYTRFQLQPSPLRLLLHIWLAHVAMFSLFTSLFPAITTVFVPLLFWILVAVLSTGRRTAPA